MANLITRMFGSRQETAVAHKAELSAPPMVDGSSLSMDGSMIGNLNMSYQSTGGYYDQALYGNSNLPYVTTKTSTQWIYYGINNLYPQYLVDLVNGSPMHAAICNRKAKMMAGGDLVVVPNANMSAQEENQLATLLAFADGEQSLHEVAQEAALSWMVFGAMALEVIWSRDFKSIAQIKHVPVENLRLGHPDYDTGSINEFWYARDWITFRYGRPHPIAAFNPANKKDYAQVLYTRRKGIGVEFYGIPGYNSACSWITANKNVGLFYEAETRNCFSPGYTIVINKAPKDKQTRDEIVNKMRDKFTGGPNAGKFQLFFNDGDKDSAPVITPVEQNDQDKRYVVVNEKIVSEIMTSHEVTNPELFGVLTPGKLGSSELEESYNIFEQTVIEPDRLKLAKVLTRLLRAGGLDVNVEITKFQPFSAAKAEENTNEV